jgi:RNA polymerase sigma-70 factor (ECF subfamily)
MLDAVRIKIGSGVQGGVSELRIDRLRAMAETCASLLIRLKDRNDAASWSEFDSLYRPLLERYVGSQGLRGADRADVVQEILVRLLGAFERFHYDPRRGRFRAWLKSIARSCVIDWRRRTRRSLPLSPRPLGEVPAGNHDFDWDLEHRRRVLDHAIAAVRADSQEKTWRCFERHVLQRQSAHVVAREVGLTDNGVYINSARILARLSSKCAQFDEHLCDGRESLLP